MYSSRRKFTCVDADADEDARKYCCQALVVMMTYAHAYGIESESKICTVFAKYKCGDIFTRRVHERK